MNYITKYLLKQKEQDRIKTLDYISTQFMPRECYEKPEVVRQTFYDYVQATIENEEAFEEVLSQL